MPIESKSNVRRPICTVRTIVIFFAVLLCALLLGVIIYAVVSYTRMRNAFGTLTCTITRQDIGFHEDRHYMLCQIENQIIDAPNISIASTGDDRLVNDFSIWNQTDMFYLPDRIGERFPNLFVVGSGFTSVRSLQRSNFVGFRRLRSVFVTNSDLEDIEHGTFDPLVSLQLLQLSHNKIKGFDTSWFENKPSLSWLNFESNEIEFIPPGCFDNLPSLGSLFLNSNKITSIASPLFLHNNLMQTLHLRTNPLEFISDTAFDGNFNRLTITLLSSATTCFPDFVRLITIPPDDWRNIVRENCNGTNVLRLE